MSALSLHNKYSAVCMYHHLFIQLCVGRHLVCFHLTVLTDAAVSMGLSVPLCDPVFIPFGCVPVGGTAAQHGSSVHFREGPPYHLP